MTEQDKKLDVLEHKFREVEAELVEKIKLVHKESLEEFPAGVGVEVASDEEKDLRLYIDSNGKWSVRFLMSGFKIKGEPNLSRILDNFLFVTDKNYREFDKEIQDQYLNHNMETFTKGLMEKMQLAITNLG
jgi:hypothetical protein